jgi:hypothetical protein
MIPRRHWLLSLLQPFVFSGSPEMLLVAPLWALSSDMVQDCSRRKASKDHLQMQGSLLRLLLFYLESTVWLFAF